MFLLFGGFAEKTWFWKSKQRAELHHQVRSFYGSWQYGVIFKFLIYFDFFFAIRKDISILKVLHNEFTKSISTSEGAILFFLFREKWEYDAFCYE